MCVATISSTNLQIVSIQILAVELLHDVKIASFVVDFKCVANVAADDKVDKHRVVVNICIGGRKRTNEPTQRCIFPYIKVCMGCVDKVVKSVHKVGVVVVDIENRDRYRSFAVLGRRCCIRCHHCHCVKILDFTVKLLSNRNFSRRRFYLKICRCAFCKRKGNGLAPQV